MEIGKAQGVIVNIQGMAKDVHSLIMSNAIKEENPLQVDDKVHNLFEKFDSKLNSVAANVYNVHEIKNDPYIYRKPSINSTLQNERVDAEFVKIKLQEMKSRVEKIQDEWKEEKYKVVDHQTNKIAYLNNTNRGNITKAIGDIDSLIELF